MKKISVIALLIVTAAIAWTQNVTITQIDTSGLLLNQLVQAYAYITTAKGQPVKDLTLDDIAVFESSGGDEFEPVPELISVTPQAARGEGAQIMLLFDNSGSMYETNAGVYTDNPATQPAAQAKQAAVDFISSISNRNDEFALASFNKSFNVHVPMTKSKNRIIDAVNDITRPAKGEGYTELYAALKLSAQKMGLRPGRKIIVVLSDGRNEYFIDNPSNKEHPVWGNKKISPEGSLDELQRNGVTLYAVNYKKANDPGLPRIVRSSGGKVFNAANTAQLASVYRTIRERIDSEFKIAWRPGMETGEQRNVKIEFAGASGEAIYYSSSLMGKPLEKFSFLFLIPPVMALLLFLFFLNAKLDKKNREVSLDVLNSGNATIAGNSFTVAKGSTVIGAADEANVTIAGVPDVVESHATIIHDDKKDSYTLVSDNPVKVNNRDTRKKQLKAGDVISVGGTTLVFDDEVYNKKNK